MPPPRRKRSPKATPPPRRPRAARAPAARPAAPALRGKLWLEAGGRAVLSEAAADLLDQIDACGSVSAAARRLRFAYRRAWLMVDAANRAWAEPLVVTATGGRRGGGARLTDFGRHVLRAYRDLQLQLEHLLDAASDPFAPAGAPPPQ